MEKEAEQKLKNEKIYAESIVETLHEPLLVLNSDLTVKSANPAFYHHFKVNKEETLGRKIYHLGNNQWDIPALRELLEDVLPDSNVFNDFEVDHEFEDIGHRTMLINARRLDHVQLILLGIRDITERKKHELTMQKMLNVEVVGVLRFSDEGELMYANDTFLDMTGYTRDEFQNEKPGWRDFTPEEYIEISEKEIGKLKRTGKIGPYEKEYLRKDGSRFWMMFAGSSLGDGTFVEFCIDVSDKKKAEHALEENEERLRLTLDAMEMGSWMREYTSEKLYIDEKNAQIFGFEGGAQTIKVEKIYERMHPDDRDRVQNAAKAAWEKGSGYSEEFRVLINGEERWLAGQGKVVKDGTRKMIGINYDITKRKKTEKALRDSRKRYKNLFESIDEGFCIIHMIFGENEKPVDYRFMEVNPAFEKQTGLKNAAGKTIRELEPNLEQYWYDMYGRIAKTGKPARFQQKAQCLEGRSFDVYAFRIGHSEENKVAVLFTDITRQLKNEEELKRAKEAAEEAAKIKEEFLAHMSHEIRTPLNSIVGLSHLLMEQPHDKQQEKNLKYLNTASESLHSLINDILDYSKLRAGKWKIKPETVTIRKCIEDLIVTHLPAATGKKIKLGTNVDENIPEQVMTDESKLHHVLGNLISNAVKFTEEGGVNVDVKLNRRKNKKLWLEFSVSDTGIGIKKKQLEHIFDEFRQADHSTIKQYQGTGLGLAIVKMYLKILDSKINVESKPGNGSRFWFVLPVEEAEEKETKKPEAKLPAEVDLDHARILIVEDDSFSRLMLSQMLTLWGIKHDQAENGKECVELAEKNNYDIIYIDIHMPVMDGFEATRRLRNMKNYANKPIFALTADVTDGVTEQVKSGLFTGKTIKPFDPDKLYSDILKIFSGNYFRK